MNPTYFEQANLNGVLAQLMTARRTTEADKIRLHESAHAVACLALGIDLDFLCSWHDSPFEMTGGCRHSGGDPYSIATMILAPHFLLRGVLPDMDPGSGADYERVLEMYTPAEVVGIEADARTLTGYNWFRRCCVALAGELAANGDHLNGAHARAVAELAGLERVEAREERRPDVYAMACAHRGRQVGGTSGPQMLARLKAGTLPPEQAAAVKAVYKVMGREV